MIFQDAIVEFGFNCRARKLSVKTIGNYQKQLRYFNYIRPVRKLKRKPPVQYRIELEI